MLRAVFVRTLKPGVTDEEFLEAWLPDFQDGTYPAAVSVSRNTADDRQVITILELEIPMEELPAAARTLTRPDALGRLAEIVESTQLEGVYEEVSSLGARTP